MSDKADVIIAGDSYYCDVYLENPDGTPIAAAAAYTALIVSTGGNVPDPVPTLDATVISGPGGIVRVSMDGTATTGLLTSLPSGYIRLKQTDIDITILEYEYKVTP